LGDLGGKITSETNQRACVYTVAFLAGKEELKAPLRFGEGFGEGSHLTMIEKG
jgi:hypothetical protein